MAVGQQRTGLLVAWGLAGLIAVVLALGSASFTMAQITARTNSILAYRLASYDGQILARRASTIIEAGDASSDQRETADRISRQALERDATAVSALVTLGLNAEARGDVAGARRLFAQSERLSRRNLVTQLWAIEDAVRRNLVADALDHYDVALRTEPQSASILYPVLASASADPAVQTELVRVLVRRPEWGGRFVDFVAEHGPGADLSARLFSKLARAGVSVPASAQARIINALVDHGHGDRAWVYYASVRPGADRRRLKATDFAIVPDPPSVLDWMTFDDGGITGSMLRSDQGGVFDFAAPVAGPLLRRIRLLPAGSYRLTGRSQGLVQTAGTGIYWALGCGNGRELGRIELPASNLAGGTFSGEFIVPSDCPVQVLTLVARSSDAVGGITGQIDRVALLPIG